MARVKGKMVIVKRGKREYTEKTVREWEGIGTGTSIPIQIQIEYSKDYRRHRQRSELREI